jgi:serine/threonine-protein phosphatase 2A activator
LFLASDTYTLLLAFIFSLTESVQHTKISDIQRDNLSPLVRNVSKILDDVEDRMRSCPPEDQGGSRFGNPVFRVFVDKIAEASDGWQARLGIEDAGAREEAGTYFQHAFGNRTRIDYGSGHELNFVVWLYVVSLDRFRLMCVVC